MWQDKVLAYATGAGWEHFHDTDSRRNRAGFPDLVLIRPPRLVWVELKTEIGRVKPAQKAWEARLLACSQEYHLWRPSDWDQVMEILR